MITGISIENFKLFGKRVDIELAPITLLFGRNSSGKSSVLQALEYARQVVVDADPTATGQLLGGFRSILHQGKGSTDLAITVRLTPSPQALVQHLQMAESPGSDEISALKLEDFEYTLRVGLDADYQRSFVSEYAVGIPGQPVLAVTANAGPRKAVLWADVCIDETDFDIESPWFPLDITDLVIAGQQPHDELTQPWPSQKPRNMTQENLGGCANLAQWPSALPCRPFEVDYEGDELDLAALVAGHAALNKALLGSRALLGEYLSGVRHIGPIRAVPLRGLADYGWPSIAGWYDGQAAYAALQHADLLAKEVSSLMAQAGLGYTLAVNQVGYGIALSELRDKLTTAATAMDTAAALRDTFNQLDNAATTAAVELVDSRNFARPHLRDVGAGVGQLLPVLTAAAMRNEPRPDGTSSAVGLIAVEQPELHVHPAVQANLGDVFASTIRDNGELNGRQYLIETHSEHLVLRLLRRIRETTEGTLPDSCDPLRPQDVAIYFFGGDGSEAEVTRIRIDEDGEFLDRWPEGFFAERLQEL